MKTSVFFSRFAVIVVTITMSMVLSSFTTPTNVTDNAESEFVEMLVKEMKAELPMDLGGGMAITAVYTANSNFVVECTCTDSAVDLIRLGFSTLSKEEALKGLYVDASTKLMGKICAEANYGMRWVFLTRSRTNQTELFFTASELKTFLLSNPAN